MRFAGLTATLLKNMIIKNDNERFHFTNTKLIGGT